MSNDPWKHRSQNMACKTCMWFVPKVVARLTVFELGRCRRHAPSMNGYPVVFVNDWCGDHKLDENKLLEEVPRPKFECDVLNGPMVARNAGEPQFDSTLGRVGKDGYPIKH